MAIDNGEVGMLAAECCFSKDAPALGEESDSDASTASGSFAWSSRRKQCNAVRFEDLVETIEIESLKDFTRFTPADRARANSEWRTELFAQLHATELAVQRAAVVKLQGAVLELTLTDEELGSAVIQRALAVAPLLERLALIRELHGSVPQLLNSEHGGKVLLSCLQLLPRAAGFIAKEIEGHAALCTEIMGGAELICSLLTHLERVHSFPLVAELLRDLDELCCDKRASSVLECLLEYGSVADQKQTSAILTERVQHLEGEARSVLEKVLNNSL